MVIKEIGKENGYDMKVGMESRKSKNSYVKMVMENGNAKIWMENMNKKWEWKNEIE